MELEKEDQWISFWPLSRELSYSICGKGQIQIEEVEEFELLDSTIITLFCRLQKLTIITGLDCRKMHHLIPKILRHAY